MKRALVALLLLGAVTACGTAPTAPSTPDTATATSPTPTLTASATPTPSFSVTRPSSSPSVRTSTKRATTAGSASAAAPVGTVVVLPNGGVEFTTEAQIMATSWIPTDAKPYLAGVLKNGQSANDSPDCTIALYVDAYRVADLISGGVGGCGGAAVLWGKSGGAWKQVIAGQDVPGCAEIRKVWSGTIPADFFGGQCLEGGTVVPFKP